MKRRRPYLTRLLPIFLPVLALGCSLQQAKTAVGLIDDAVRALCLASHADALGVSPEQLKDGICTTERELAPFRQAVLGAKREASIRAGLAKP